MIRIKLTKTSRGTPELRHGPGFKQGLEFDSWRYLKEYAEEPEFWAEVELRAALRDWIVEDPDGTSRPPDKYREYEVRSALGRIHIARTDEL